MKKTCLSCKEFKEITAKGLCKNCYSKKRYTENREKEHARNKKYRLENREKVKARQRKYNLENKEKIKARKKKWRLENPKKAKARNKKYNLGNSEKRKAFKKKWRLENPGKRRETRLKRRGYGEVKKGTFDRVIANNIFKYGSVTCEKCKKENLKSPEYHIDHIKPLSRGGDNSFNNLQILCAKCNMEKHTETADYRGDKIIIEPQGNLFKINQFLKGENYVKDLQKMAPGRETASRKAS